MITLLLAQADPDPNMTQQVLLVLNLLFMVLIGGGTILSWFTNRGKNENERTITNDPLNVAFEENFVSRPDFDELKAKVDKNDSDRRADLKSMEGRIQEVETELLKAGEERAERIFARLNMVSQDLQGQITNMPDRLIKILRNTGVIKS